MEGDKSDLWLLQDKLFQCKIWKFWFFSGCKSLHLSLNSDPVVFKGNVYSKAVI